MRDTIKGSCPTSRFWSDIRTPVKEVFLILCIYEFVRCTHLRGGEREGGEREGGEREGKRERGKGEREGEGEGRGGEG